MTRFLLLFCVLSSGWAADALLVVAHGSRRPGWNDRVVKLVDQLQWPGAAGVAFLTTDDPASALPAVAARLDSTGASRIVIVPLFVSSFSEHYEELRYYSGAAASAPEHAHGEPLKTKARLVLKPAMDDHALIGSVLAEAARELSSEPSSETVILVAHGPNGDADNERWLACLRVQAERLVKAQGYRGADVVTLRDDAAPAVRQAATEQLRATVQKAAARGKALVVPVLVSVGHIQGEIESDVTRIATGLFGLPNCV
ncbi:MAG: hypothetical protein HYZ57_08965 [Acidobacteria bacterium]|nr:hypothetical protein [Acidobacteriota bacterium]